MRRHLGLLVAFLLGVSLATATALAQRSKDSTVVDPDVHHVLFENEHVHVFEGMASAGAKSPMHTHPPFVLVSLGTARLKLTLPDGSTQIFDFHPGQVQWIDGAEHSWQLLAGEAHVIAVEVKSARKQPAP